MATYSEICGELQRLRAKWKTMTDKEKAAAEGLRNGLNGLNGSNGLEIIDTNKKNLEINESR